MSNPNTRVQYGRTGEFPIVFNDSALWYLVIHTDKGKAEERDFSNSKTDSKNLIYFLENDFDSRTDKLYGIWNGKFRTSLFVLEPHVIIEKIKEKL